RFRSEPQLCTSFVRQDCCSAVLAATYLCNSPGGLIFEVVIFSAAWRLARAGPVQRLDSGTQQPSSPTRDRFEWALGSGQFVAPSFLWVLSSSDKPCCLSAPPVNH